MPTEYILARAANTVVKMVGALLREVCAARTASGLVPLEKFAFRMTNAKFLRGHQVEFLRGYQVEFLREYQLEFHAGFCIWLSLYL